MLGASNSGKSTFIDVLYDLIAEGRHYVLHTAPATRLRNNQEVSGLRHGAKVPPTGPEPVPHRYTLGSLRDGDYRELAFIDLVDFRGAAPLELDVPNTDSAQLYKRIPESGSIWVTIDATHFTKPLMPWRPGGNVTVDDVAIARARAGDIAAAVIARDMTDQVAHALSRRKAQGGPPPSVVVLLSKADLLDDQGDRPGRDPGEVRAEVEEFVLPVVRELGRRYEFFPVSIGHYASTDGDDRLAQFEPRGVVAPLFYALWWFLADHADDLVREQAALDASYRQADERRARLARRPPFIRWFWRHTIEQNRVTLDRMRTGLDAYRDRIEAIPKEMDVLKGLLEQRPARSLWHPKRQAGHRWCTAGPGRPIPGGRRSRPGPGRRDGWPRSCSRSSRAGATWRAVPGSCSRRTRAAGSSAWPARPAS
jgi:hypothetical protein